MFYGSFKSAIVKIIRIIDIIQIIDIVRSIDILRILYVIPSCKAEDQKADQLNYIR